MPEQTMRLADVLPAIREQLDAGRSVRLKFQGISMMPMIRGGRDSVILSPLPEKLKKYDLPLFRRDNGQFVMHRIVKAGEDYTCIGDNQFVYEHHVRHDQMIAVVTAFTRKGKAWQVTDPAYRIYCRLWCFTRPVRHIWIRLRQLPGRAVRYIKNRLCSKQ